MTDLFDEKHLETALDLLVTYYSYFKDDVKLNIDKNKILEMLKSYRSKFESIITDVGYEVEQLLLDGKNVLFEGAQATLLDIDHGIYPFNTSSTTVASGASSGAGLGMQYITDRIGVVKAYTSRVGGGPVMGELDYTKDPGKLIQTEGYEFGTTTGRPRRIAWLDLVAVRYTIRINGLTGLAITKVDILGLLPEFQVIIAYEDPETHTQVKSQFPAQLKKFSTYKPVLKTFKGWGKKEPAQWKQLMSQGFEHFPAELQTFIEFIEKETKTPVYIIGLGPEREFTFEKIVLV